MSTVHARVLSSLGTSLVLIAVAAPTAPGIVGGRVADRPFPAMGALERDGSFICGVSLVRERVALTAAHCVEDAAADGTPAAPLTVLFGTARRSDEVRGDRVAVRRVTVHESYGTPESSSNDVALLRLDRAPAAPAAPIRVVTPAERPLWAPGTSATTIGWGGQSFPSLFGATDDLMQVEVPIRTDGECADAYRGSLGWDPATMVCAGAGTGGRDSCQGDSGGPLMVVSGGEPVLVGVVSFGLGCGFPGLYGVYGRIGEPALADWLVRNAGPVTAPTAPTTSPGASSRVLGVTGASRRARVLRFRLVARRPVRSVTISVERRDGRRTTRVARTTRTRLAASGRTIRLRLPATGPRRPLRVRVRAVDDLGRRVGIDRLLRTTG